MDIMMPVMDGYEAAKAIRTCGREDRETIPIIAATACVSEEARQKCVQVGMNEFLEKLLERKLDNEKKERLQRIQCPLPKKLVH